MNKQTKNVTNCFVTATCKISMGLSAMCKLPGNCVHGTVREIGTEILEEK